jgi:hypothetical protein
MSATDPFHWVCHPEAEQALSQLINKMSRANSDILKLQEELARHTSTRLSDWVDHIAIEDPGPHESARYEKWGFVTEAVTASYRVFNHPSAQFPKIVIYDQASSLNGVAISVESIADFLMVRGISRHIEGTMYSPYRRCCISTEKGVSFWVVERRTGCSMEPIFSHDYQEGYQERYLQAQEIWQTRSRDMEEDDREAMAYTFTLAERLITLVGQDLAAWIILDVERKYWQMRNQAAQIQKNRQDRLGMGWANHDHHTFRSSRDLFPQLLRFFEMLGFFCRERFYAGKEAGWGAQVMEHPHCRLILFLDVDLEEHELGIDFRNNELPPLNKLRTVGLWCALHGDSLLKAGMHHLEAQFSFEDLTRDLNQLGIKMMEPFSKFSYLHQAFTQGEIWPVEARRLEKLLHRREITPEQAEKFRLQGALGSHLENLQRQQGYKGFNKHNVSDIIQRTDPRKTLK